MASRSRRGGGLRGVNKSLDDAVLHEGAGEGGGEVEIDQEGGIGGEYTGAVCGALENHSMINAVGGALPCRVQGHERWALKAFVGPVWLMGRIA